MRNWTEKPYLKYSLKLFVEVRFESLDTLREHHGLQSRAIVRATQLRRLEG